MRMVKLVFSIIVLNISVIVFSYELTDNLTKTKLDNGLNVIVKEIRDVPLVTVLIYYNVGFRDSTNSINQMPHFVEHILFKGTKDFSKERIIRKIVEAGGEINGFTEFNNTAYFETIPSNMLETVIQIESSRMTDSLFDPKEIELEKNVVMSEARYRGNFADLKYNKKVYEALGIPFSDFFDTDKNLATIKDINRDNAYDFYKKYYRPDNATIIITGDVETNQAIELCKKYFLNIKNVGDKPKQKEIKVNNLNESVYIEEKGVVAQPFANRYFPFRGFDADDFEQIVARFIVNSSLIPELDFWMDKDFGYIIQRFNENAEYPADILDFDSIKSRFEIEKNKLFQYKKSGQEKIQDIAFNIYYFEAYCDGIEYYEKLFKEYEKVSFTDVKNFVLKYLKKGNDLTAKFIATKIDNSKTKGDFNKISDNFGQNMDYRFLEKGSLEDIEYYKNQIESTYAGIKKLLENFKSNITNFTLDNGLTTALVKNSVTNKVIVSFVVEAGYQYSDKPFVSDYLSRMVFDGGPQIFDKNNIINNGGRWNDGFCSDKYSVLTVEGLSGDIEAILRGISLSVKDRIFNKLILESKIEDNIRAYQNREKDQRPDYIAWNNMIGELGKGTIYNKRVNYNEKERATVTIDDLLEFYRNYYCPERANIIITGNFKDDEIKTFINKYFSNWTAGENIKNVEKKDISLKRTLKEKTIITTMPNKYENIVFLGQSIDNEISSEEILSLKVAYQILSSPLNGKLYRRIRNNLGLTYGVDAWIANVDMEKVYYSGGFMMLSNKNINRGLDEFKKIISDMVKKGPNEIEFLYEKNIMLNKSVFDFKDIYSTNNTILRTLFFDDINKPDFNKIIESIEVIKNLNKEEIKRVFSKYVSPDNYIISIAGPYKK